MFTHLPFELRLLIWQFALCEPRIVYINLRCLPGRLPSGRYEDCASESISPTPIPALLHLCRETRILALAHYEITFGHPKPPRLPLRHNVSLESSCDGSETDTGGTTQVQDPTLARYAPKIYINFEHDTVLFGRAFQPLGEMPRRLLVFSKTHAHFPSKEEFEPGQLTRVENLGLSFFPGGAHIGLSYLAHRVESGEFPKLRNLYLCLQASDPDFSRSVDFVRLESCTEKNEDGVTKAQGFVSRCKSRMLLPGYNLRQLGTEEGLRAISRLDGHPHLRDFLLRNGADPDEPLKIVCIKETKTCGQKEIDLSV